MIGVYDNGKKNEIKNSIKNGIEQEVKYINEHRLNTLRVENEKLEKKLKQKGITNNTILDLLEPKPWTTDDLLKCVNSVCAGCDMEEENTRCKGCVFLDRYVDMGMSSDMCSIVGGLESAIQATRCKGKCPNKLTYKEACKYVERRNKNKKGE